MRTVPTRFLLLVLFVLPTLAVPCRGDESGDEAPGDTARVTVPLADYLELRERAEAADRERERLPEPAVAELVSQDTSLTVEDGTAKVETVFEVEIRGDQREPLALPLTGIATRATIDPVDGASLHRSKTGQLVLVPHRPGTYRIEVEGAAPLETTGTGSRLTLAATDAPVATTRLELPQELDWTIPGAVVVGEGTSGGRRRLQLALPRGRELPLDLGRDLDEETVQEALVQAVLVTVLDLDPLGNRRHDIVLYEVLRGEVSSFELTVPSGLTVEQAGSDEGEVIPLREAGRLTVHRNRRLTGTGYVVLTSPAPSAGSLPLEPVEPSVPVRAQYLVLASTVVTEIQPRPETVWSRVDLDDLPTLARQDLRTLRPTAAWRLSADAEAELSVTLDPLPPVPVSRTLVARRETTTLLTREGSLVHQDRFTVRRVVSAFELEVPDTMKLWSTSVDGHEVRPVMRGGRVAIPLTLQGEEEAQVEVVVLEKERLPEGRSQLALTLPRVDLPVLDHRWRVLLPETHRYRYEEGTLTSTTYWTVAEKRKRKKSVGLATFIGSLPGRPAARLTGRVTSEDGSPLPGATVAITAPGCAYESLLISGEHGSFHFPPLPAGWYELTAQLEGFQTGSQTVELRDGETREIGFTLDLGALVEEIVVSASTAPAPGPSKRELERRAEQRRQQSLLDQELERLNQGLVGGVRPLPVKIPETGKLLLLSGALPPQDVTALVSVKRGR